MQKAWKILVLKTKTYLLHGRFYHLGSLPTICYFIRIKRATQQIYKTGNLKKKIGMESRSTRTVTSAKNRN